MHIFVAASYSAHVNYETGEVDADYKQQLEELLVTIEALGHTVFCALRADNYKINASDPAVAFHLDKQQIIASDVLLAWLDTNVSAGVQTEIGFAAALDKKVILAHSRQHQLAYFNSAMVQAGVAVALSLPIISTELQAALA